MAIKKTDLKKLKELLLTQRKEIVDHLAEVEKDSNVGMEEIHGDASDIASIEISQQQLQKLGVRQRKLLNKIDHALAKFDTDDYGVCELTGEDIPVKRLYARPVAQYTIEAKQELERKERQYKDDDDDEFDMDLTD